MSKHFWHEKYIGEHICIYCGRLGWWSFKVGLHLGTQNSIYLGLFCFGIDFEL